MICPGLGGIQDLAPFKKGDTWFEALRLGLGLGFACGHAVV